MRVWGGKVLYESPLNTQPFWYRRSAGAAGSLHDRVMETEKNSFKGVSKISNPILRFFDPRGIAAAK